jgi:hypothetical protein
MLGCCDNLLELFQTELLVGAQEVWEMPSNHVRKSGHYNTSLSFSSPELAVLSDGAGTLHVVHTGIRRQTTTWKVRKICLVLICFQGLCLGKFSKQQKHI